MAEEFIPCSAVFLPPELNLAAAEIAVDQNAANRPLAENLAQTGMVLAPEHLAIMTSRYWGNKGVRLTVSFMEQTPNELQNKILAHMNAWREYANVQFVLSSTDPQVRITRAGAGYWSYLGTDVLSIPRNQATMCLQAFSLSTPESEYKRVVRHETGHTLGCPHEHMRRQIIERLDREKTIAYFKQTQGWSAAMTTQQVLTPLGQESIMSTPDADENSIMTYSLPASITKDGRPIIGGIDIEDQDQKFISDMYPKPTIEVKPPPPVGYEGFEFHFGGDTDTKQFFVSLPAGWKVSPFPTQGHEDMADSLTKLADQLEALVPASGADLDTLKQSSIGGVIGGISKLVTALRSGDYNAALLALIELLGMFAGKTGDGSISFGQQAAAARFDWSRLIGILTKLLPLILAG